MQTHTDICNMIDLNIVHTNKSLNPQKVGNNVVYDEKYLNSSNYKAQVLINQVMIMQAVKLSLSKPH